MNKSPKKNDAAVTFKAPAALVQKSRILATSQNRSLSGLIRQLLAEAVAKR